MNTVRVQIGLREDRGCRWLAGYIEYRGAVADNPSITGYGEHTGFIADYLVAEPLFVAAGAVPEGDVRLEALLDSVRACVATFRVLEVEGDRGSDIATEPDYRAAALWRRRRASQQRGRVTKEWIGHLHSDADGGLSDDLGPTGTAVTLTALGAAID